MQSPQALLPLYSISVLFLVWTFQSNNSFDPWVELLRSSQNKTSSWANGAPTPAKVAQHFPSDPKESWLPGQGLIVNFEEDGIGHPSTQLVTKFLLFWWSVDKFVNCKEQRCIFHNSSHGCNFQNKFMLKLK